MNTKDIAIGALLATTTIFAVGGGVGPAQRAEIPHIVTVTSAVADLNGSTQVHLLYRTWSDGQVDYARVWNGFINGDAVFPFFAPNNVNINISTPNQTPNREQWQILAAN